MKISDIKKWAKQQGYTITKDNGDEEKDEPVKYYWKLDSDSSISGEQPSVSKVTLAVFNHMTNNRWIDYQNTYLQNKETSQPSHE